MTKATTPAKINLIFEVGELDNTGYHPVNSLYLELDLREEIKIKPGTHGIAINVAGDLPARHLSAVPTDSRNLIHKVAVALCEKLGIAVPAIEIDLYKRIPVAGGMAGGSADAAAMLVALNTYLFENLQTPLLTNSELKELAATLGSDIPFLIDGGLAIGVGRGEQLTQLAPLGFETHWVICVSNEGLSTPVVFGKFDELFHVEPFSDFQELEISSIEDLALVMANDLEEAAIALLPSITGSKSKLEELGALKAMVSGSGPSVIGLFKSLEEAELARVSISNSGGFALVATASYAGTRLEH